ncbi:hypothetical protein Syun_009628 [Stephania yunnanensis]|uniref:Uncharacterized protein n=1 Tax=Stephania yunnanensis TaxID=152371 RepID=A0AAP0KH12_9MAGN
MQRPQGSSQSHRLFQFHQSRLQDLYPGLMAYSASYLALPTPSITLDKMPIPVIPMMKSMSHLNTLIISTQINQGVSRRS